MFRSRYFAPESPYSFPSPTRRRFAGADRLRCRPRCLDSRTTPHPSAEHRRYNARVLGEQSMSAITVNAFPPLHTFNSSRSWFLALIVLLQAGFFWVRTHGVTIGSVNLPPPLVLVNPAPPRPQPPPKPHVIDNPVVRRVFVPVVDLPQLVATADSQPPQQTTQEPPPVGEIVREQPGAGPLIVQPQADARFPF